ncbi:MAG: LytTR family transcriptional regulator DNA-binding domain-containing protein [Beduini sp.]|uniref:LytTR family transcriptional regulator DNA-binding domain-containing protein n=1 Tax=Beduini sp. TaxID=1922300 RepID=UPI0039A31C91
MNYLENISEQMQIDGMIINIECDSKSSDQILEYLQTWKQIGIVTREIFLYDRLKVKEYLRLFSCLNKIKQYQDIIDMMELHELMNLRCHQLTHSQKRRIAIARELLRDPKVMYIQEPLTDLDETSFNIILRWTNTLKQQMKLITTSLSLKSTLLLPGNPYSLFQGQLQKIYTDDYFDLLRQEPMVYTKISAKVEDKVFLFDPEDISYIEAQNSKTIICVRDSMFPCQYTLEELEVKLKRFGFYRCHRSYLVNMQKVEEVKKWTKNSYSLKLKNMEDKHVPLSKGRIDELRELYDF